MYEDNMLKVKGFDDCIVGVLEQYGTAPSLCYSLTMMKDKILSADESITEEEADSYLMALIESPPAVEDMAPVAFISSNWQVN